MCEVLPLSGMFVHSVGGEHCVVLMSHPTGKLSLYGVGVLMSQSNRLLSVPRLAESELLVACVELGNDNSRWVVCVGLPFFMLFVCSV